MADFETRDGKIILYPVVGWASAIAPMTGVLRLEFATSDLTLGQGKPEAVQLAMTEKQMRELAELLQRMADRLAAQPRGEGRA